MLKFTRNLPTNCNVLREYIFGRILFEPYSKHAALFQLLALDLYTKREKEAGILKGKLCVLDRSVYEVGVFLETMRMLEVIPHSHYVYVRRKFEENVKTLAAVGCTEGIYIYIS